MKKLIFLLLTVFPMLTNAQTFFNKSEPFAHTYSIVARDTITGDMGVAVQSHWFSVGSIVSWGEAGVGVIATQSFVNPSFGPRGLALLKQGIPAQQVLDFLIASDEGRAVRQLAVLDANGNVATHTGKKCIEAAGHQQGDNFSVQANMMYSKTVWPAMSEAYEKASDLPLAERMIAALEAAETEGGDIRGKQSAAILVVKGTPTGNLWEDRLIDLRVEDHSEPIKELKRVLRVHRAYEHMNEGDVAVEKGEIDRANEAYTTARNMFPENVEMQYWQAVTMANTGQFKESLPLFKTVFAEDEKWRELTQRIVKNGLLTVDAQKLQQILSLGLRRHD